MVKMKAILGEAKQIAKDKFKRYLIPEIVGTATAYGSVILAQHGFDINNPIAIGYIGAMGENLGFYGTAVPRQMFRDYRDAKEQGKPYGVQGIQGTLVRLLLEFGIPELTDTPIVRPAAMGAGEHLLGTTIGVGAGKIAADAAFYLQAGTVHEFIKRYPEYLGDGSLSFLARKYIKEPLTRRMRK
ncbi:MAG TPA: hypothetical protein VJK03_04790 [Candidatus Nanoarchaeia archaeon]|nr:hypothetical protein [Candidatus Nanoarchaeia archaeon]